MAKEFNTYLEEQQNFQSILQSNKEEIDKLWDEIFYQEVEDTAVSFGWDDPEEIEQTGCETAEEWYDDYAHATGYQAEYSTAEYILKELKNEGLDVDPTNEDQQEQIIKFCGYTTL